MNISVKANNVQPEKPDILEYSRWHQYITRYWMKYLSPSELMVLLFILDRTIGWQKYSEVITRRHMLKGIASGGTIFHLGTSLSASTLDTTLNRLFEKGLIERRPIMRGTTRYIEFSINLDWEPDELPRRLQAPRRKTSRRLSRATPINGITHPGNGTHPS